MIAFSPLDWSGLFAGEASIARLSVPQARQLLPYPFLPTMYTAYDWRGSTPVAGVQYRHGTYTSTTGIVPTYLTVPLPSMMRTVYGGVQIIILRTYVQYVSNVCHLGLWFAEFCTRVIFRPVYDASARTTSCHISLDSHYFLFCTLYTVQYGECEGRSRATL